jgi:hypothetical protein
MNPTKALALAAALIASGACATLFSAGPVPVTFQSDTPGAEVWVNGTMRGQTPLVLELNNKQAAVVTFKQSGRKDYTVEIGNKVRGGFVVLDVLGGLIPVVIDAATGEWKTLDTRFVSANLITQAGAPAKP